MQPLHVDQQIAASLEIENGHPQSIDHVFLNQRNGDGSNSTSRGVQQSAQEQILNTICNLAPQVVEETNEEHDTEPPSDPNNNPLCSLQVPQNLNPVNEFTSNDQLFY